MERFPKPQDLFHILIWKSEHGKWKGKTLKKWKGNGWTFCQIHKGQDFLLQRQSVSDFQLVRGSEPHREASGVEKVLVPSLPLLLIWKRRQVLMKLPTLQHPTMVYQLACASKLAKAFFSKTIEYSLEYSIDYLLIHSQLRMNQMGAFKDGWKSWELW